MNLYHKFYLYFWITKIQTQKLSHWPNIQTHSPLLLDKPNIFALFKSKRGLSISMTSRCQVKCPAVPQRISLQLSGSDTQAPYGERELCYYFSGSCAVFLFSSLLFDLSLQLTRETDDGISWVMESHISTLNADCCYQNCVYNIISRLKSNLMFSVYISHY